MVGSKLLVVVPKSQSSGSHLPVVSGSMILATSKKFVIVLTRMGVMLPVPSPLGPLFVLY